VSGAAGRFVLAIVPAHDEEAAVGRTVRGLRDVPMVSRVVVVADGCGDRTADEAVAAGATVFSTPRRMGKGTAVESALDHLPSADAYLFVDGDVGGTASRVAALIEPVLAGRLELAIGRLPPQGGGGFGIVKRLARWTIRRLTGFRAEEPLSGQRAMTRQVLVATRPLSDGFGMETAMTIDAVRLGFRVGEVPVEMTHRATGRSASGFVHRGRQGGHIIAAMLPRALGMR
jgi:glycosyltransferase involved in cell wall biosynthesis